MNSKIFFNRTVKNFIFLWVMMFFSLKNMVAQSINAGSWNILQVKYNQSNQLNFFAEGQIRSLSLYDQFHYYEYKAGLNYKLGKSITSSLGAGSYQTFLEGGNFKLPKNNNEFRIWPQLTIFQDIDNWKIEHRYRTELRWTSNGFKNRYRYRLGISYPFGKVRNGYFPYTAAWSNELFFSNKATYFERNRMQFSLNTKISKSLITQLGYVHQFDYKINDEIGRDFFLIGLYVEIFNKNVLNVKEKYEVRDN